MNVNQFYMNTQNLSPEELLRSYRFNPNHLAFVCLRNGQDGDETNRLWVKEVNDAVEELRKRVGMSVEDRPNY